MKRSEALAPLSRDHHQGLFVALQLKRAEPKTAANARQDFLDFFEREGARHFRAEEEVLLPAYARHGEPDQPAVVRVLVDHVDLRRRRRIWPAVQNRTRPSCTSLASGSRATSATRSASSSR